MNRPDLTIIFICILIALLLFIRSAIVASLSDKNVLYSTISHDLDALKNQNIVLKAEILHETSFAVLEQKALQAGFRPITDADYYP